MKPDPLDAAAILAHEERKELFRIAAQRVLDDQASGRKIDPHAIEWAQNVTARFKPLGRALTTGEPKET